jgi:HPt (histidine-containing phosphotransfer) domain-containing protein
MKDCCKEYLMSQFGDEDVVGEIYNEYVESLGQKLSESEAAIASQDWIALDRAAHALKGNALAAGDEAVANVAIELRNAAKLQKLDESKGLVAKIKELQALL